MADAYERLDPLVDHLEDIAARQDRGALALLRKGFQKERSLDGLSVVLPFVPLDSPRRERAEDDALLVSALFAFHPESGVLSLPAALSMIARTSESVELRFRALLGASRQDLGEHLRHAVTLVASYGLAIDWRDLHATVRYWDHPSDRARRKWARDFWRPVASGEHTEQPA